MKPLPRRLVAWAAKHPVRFGLAVVGLALLSVISWRGYDILLGTNLATITPGQAYRSAQLSGAEFRQEIAILGLRSVINLRGPNPQNEWYRQELAACRKAGIRHYDVALSARQLPPPKLLDQLITDLRTAPRPLLVHCKNGADRSGMAAALWLILTRHEDPASAAAEELTLWRGHMPIGPATAMDRFLKLYSQTGQGMGLEQWARVEYPTLYARQEPSPVVGAGP